MDTNLSPMEHHCNLLDFVKNQDSLYKAEIKQIPLFDPNKTRKWDILQKKQFARIFYHLRGHFHDVLWLMGNFAPKLEAKNLILKNIGEEFGRGSSHEQLYIEFASALNVDIHEEIITEKNYTEFAKRFNKKHIQWLLQHHWNEKIAAFSAYERLDNVDYPQLLDLAASFGLPDRALIFFRVHTRVQHYEAVEGLLQDVWEHNPKSVVKGFEFIYRHQLNMWRELGCAIDQVKQTSREGVELLTQQ